ncbi:MAG: protoheme IX farnesyltransferase [Myxococcota bacterium]|jgi:protoheme IX farnesyltransferase
MMSSLTQAAPSEQDPGRLLSDLLALTKPRLSLLVIITASGGLWLSGSATDPLTALAAVTGTTMVVAAANTLNNYLERESDKDMARTALRPLPSGRMTANTALAFGLVLTAISIPMLTFATTPLAGLLASIALLLYVLVYTPLKRRSSINTLVGAVPGALPPLIGWTAATGQLDVGGLLLFALLFLWQIPHSLAIMIYRQKEYDSAGLVMLPSEHGIEATRRQMLLYTFALLPLPLLLMHAHVSGLLTVVVGTGLGLWWLWKAWDGFLNEGGPKWARSFFLSSLVYLCGMFAILTIDTFV